MKLLSEAELIWSSIVANSRMNRARNASGINSYEQEFKFKPEIFLQTYIEKYGQVKWLDLCCGEGKALIQAATYLSEKGLQDKATLIGFDLIENDSPIIKVKSVVDWYADDKYDLITCVHGIHYVGDKLKVLQTAFESLTPEGVFLANLDLNNIQIDQTENYLTNIFKKNKIEYSSKTRILTCKGPKMIDFAVRYKGATDQAGPNYTGQEAVTSFYSLDLS
jgi:ubiquinone/menaquinone biosynthesis C-methylase UbiE